MNFITSGRLASGPQTAASRWLWIILVGVLALAGCSSVPKLVPDMSMRTTHAVRIKSAHGQLTEQQSKAVLATLKSPEQTTTGFQRHLAIEEALVGAPLVADNKVDLLLDGAATYPAMLAAIKGARDSINMETYIIDDDEVGHTFVDALRERQQAGVQVNLIFDSVGSMATPRAFFDSLADSGINVLEYNPVNPLKLRKSWDVDQRDHRKLLVVDGKVAFIGGINISSVYSSGSFRSTKKVTTPGKVPWRDTHVRLEGPIVKEFQKLFIHTWETQQGPALAPARYFPDLTSKGDEIVRAIGSSPDEAYSFSYATLLAAIDHAEAEVCVTNAYFVPDPALLTTLKNAAKRGVKVQLLLPGKTDSALVYYASRSFYKELLKAGIRIYQREDVLLHAKTAVIDGVWSTIGSTNLDWRSRLHNQEIDAVVLGPDFGGRMLATFTQDTGAARQITLMEWRKRPLGARLKEFGARLWARAL